MLKLVSQQSKKAGHPPGTLMHTGEKRSDITDITIFDYNEAGFKELTYDSLHGVMPEKSEAAVRWINVVGLHQIDILEKLGEHYGLHPLVMEDILNTAQRPKLEDYENYIYIVAKLLYIDDKTDEVVPEQLSIVLGRDFVISFGENPAEVFEPVRERIKSGAGRIMKMGADYLAYSLIDSIVDSYFVVLERLGDEIEFAEDLLTTCSSAETLKDIHHLKKDMLYFHKSIWPFREVAGILEHGESPLIRETTRVYLHDVYDHIIQAMDTTETYRDMLSGMLDIYLSSISNRMNEVMKVLTIISTLFMPLTFIAGVYGMNFKFMPLLEWKWGYYGVLLAMALVVVFMILYFRKRKWF